MGDGVSDLLWKLWVYLDGCFSGVECVRFHLNSSGLGVPGSLTFSSFCECGSLFRDPKA